MITGLQKRSFKLLAESLTISSRIPYASCQHCVLTHQIAKSAHLGHDWLSVFILDITEWHLCALVLVDLEIGMIDVRNLVDGYCASSASYTSIRLLDSPLSCTQILVTRTAVSVVICTGPKRRPWYPFLRSSEVRSGEYVNQLLLFRIALPVSHTSWRVVS